MMFLLLILLLVNPLKATELNNLGDQSAERVILKKKELSECLQKVWGIESHTAHYLLKKIGPLLEDMTYHSIIDEFISKSRALNLNFSEHGIIGPLSREDGVCQAPNQHMVVFENPWVRILWGSSQPGERENIHTHIWKSLMVIVEPTTYEIQYINGAMETSYWPRGVYVLGIEDPYACTNVGDTADECLRFEIKE